eukprot:jgi/Mesen1/9561/ME000640S08906
MSGVSLAAGNRSVPVTGQLLEKQKEEGQNVGGLMGSVTFMQVQMIAYIVVFTASGVVPFSEMAFVVFATFYTLILSRLVFPPNTKESPEPVFGENSAFKTWATIGSALGLFLPLAYVLGGFSKGDKRAVESATPHLFLLSCQILTENIISELSMFSLPIRAFVPILYSSRRLVSLGAWVRRVFGVDMTPVSEVAVASNWPLFGQVLAVINLAFWSVNLFGFLIPYFLPRAFKRYFEMEQSSGVSGKVQDVKSQ